MSNDSQSHPSEIGINWLILTGSRKEGKSIAAWDNVIMMRVLVILVVLYNLPFSLNNLIITCYLIPEKLSFCLSYESIVSSHLTSFINIHLLPLPPSTAGSYNVLSHFHKQGLYNIDHIRIIFQHQYKT